jgi:hypothetical protein
MQLQNPIWANPSDRRFLSQEDLLAVAKAPSQMERTESNMTENQRSQTPPKPSPARVPNPHPREDSNPSPAKEPNHPPPREDRLLVTASPPEGTCRPTAHESPQLETNTTNHATLCLLELMVRRSKEIVEEHARHLQAGRQSAAGVEETPAEGQ